MKTLVVNDPKKTYKRFPWQYAVWGFTVNKMDLYDANNRGQQLHLVIKESGDEYTVKPMEAIRFAEDNGYAHKVKTQVFYSFPHTIATPYRNWIILLPKETPGEMVADLAEEFKNNPGDYFVDLQFGNDKKPVRLPFTVEKTSKLYARVEQMIEKIMEVASYG